MSDAVIGRVIPSLRFFDDAGRVRNTRDLSGAPTLLVPIYTKCHGSCPTLARSLKRAILKSNVPTGTYHVVLFSFDATDTAADLLRFREHEHLPFQWTMAGASRRDGDALTRSIGFRYFSAGGEFVHPNLVAVLDPRLKVAKIITGEKYTASEIEHALRFANGSRDWRGTLELPAMCIALLLLTLSAGYLVHLITRRRSLGRRIDSEE